MKDTDFISMSSYIRVQEKKLLDRSDVERVADAPGPAEALRMISQGSDYDFGALRRPEDYETVVREELRRVYKMAFDLAGDHPQIADIPGCKYDYHNVKAALKANFLGEKGEKSAAPYVFATPVDPLEIGKLAEKFDPKSGLPPHLIQAVAAGAEAFEKSDNPQDIDTCLDKQMYAHMLAQAEQLDSAFIVGYVRLAIDCYNVKTLLRVKSMQKGSQFLADCLAPGGNTDPASFLAGYGKSGGALSQAFAFKDYGAPLKAGIEEYERSGNYAELERLLDNALIAYLQNAKRVSFGPEVLFAYLVSKENEIRQIRIVMACKQNGIPADTLKERLRDNYA